MYELRHKNDIVAKVEILNDASQINIKEVIAPHLLPLCAQNNAANIMHWWKRRAVPASRSDIMSLLGNNNASSPHQFLLDNLALSMTDCYWVCPESYNIRWEDVSFHSNGFPHDMDFSPNHEGNASSAISSFNPSASLCGDLDKRWIRRKGHIFLVKGNMPGNSFQQSLNEVFASEVHRMQGFRNHVEYKLSKLKNGSVGCISPCFTSNEIEFVPAWEIFDKYGYQKSPSFLEQYILWSSEEGVNKSELKRFLDYQFMTDFIMTNKDRHLSNFGLLRDANTLRCIAPAPIFDTGNSMFYDGIAAINYHSLVDIHIQSLYSTEKKTIENIDVNEVDLTCLPSANAIKDFYRQDPTLSSFADKIAECFEFKCAMAEELQHGKSFSKISSEIMSFYSGRAKEENNNLQLYPEHVAKQME